MTGAFASACLSLRTQPTVAFPVRSVNALPLHGFIQDLGHGIDRFQRLPAHELSMLPSGLKGLPTLLTSAKVFDASALTDTVVVSNSFWNTLSAKLPALLLGQLLASVAFVAIFSILVFQGKFLREVISCENAAESGLAEASEVRSTTAKIPLSIDISKLLVCIIIDIIGSANEAIPVVGELVDVVYAPIAALLLRQLFQGSNVVFLLELAEEILPFTDLLPLATICWVVETFFSGGTLARALRIGIFSPTQESLKSNLLKERDAKDARILQADSEGCQRRDDAAD